MFRDQDGQVYYLKWDNMQQLDLSEDAVIASIAQVSETRPENMRWILLHSIKHHAGVALRTHVPVMIMCTSLANAQGEGCCT